jgi:BirA family biotin operon repressor/biotin-[acetyl-CoA-carboxylase] ligase
MQPLGATWPVDAGPEVSVGRHWPAPVGWHVHIVVETGSTNADLLRAAREGAPDRTVLVAANQTAGRGRLDRRWEAPPGANLLVSLLFRTIPARPHELTQRVALAAVEAAAETAGVVAVLKWPNDLLVEGRKLAGILAEAGRTGVDGRIDQVVVGLGLNVGWAPAGAARLGDRLHPLEVLGALLAAFDRLPADAGELHERYRAHLATLGQQVRVEQATGMLEGRAVDVEPDGRLVVIDGCAVTHRLDVGDVVHLRPAVTDG